MEWVTKDRKVLDISNMATDHLQNAIRMLETRYLMPDAPRMKDTAPVLRILPRKETIEQYREMKKELAQRILVDFHVDEVARANKERVVNPFEHL